MDLQNIEIQNPMVTANDSENISFEIEITPRPTVEYDDDNIDLIENISIFNKICCCLN